MAKNRKVTLIFGIAGQDGAYLAELLSGKGYDVHGTSRDAETSAFGNLRTLGILDGLTIHSTAINDFRSVLQTISRVAPDEIYNLSGQSSVGLSFQQPVETLESITIGTLNVLEAIRFLNLPVRFYNAGSGECFGDTGETPANEETAFRPRSPYAMAKAAAHWEVANYCEAYDIFACSGILFNHESPLRHTRFVTQKVTQAAARIAAGSDERLRLGRLSIQRDWGWAPEYVEAMWAMLQRDEPEDFVVATGETHALEEFVAAAFDHFDLNWRDHVDFDDSLSRPTDLASSRADASKARDKLGWTARTKMPGVVTRMAEAAARALKERD